MKKILCLFAAILMVLTVFCACSAKTVNSEKESQKAANGQNSFLVKLSDYITPDNNGSDEDYYSAFCSDPDNIEGGMGDFEYTGDELTLYYKTKHFSTQRLSFRIFADGVLQSGVASLNGGEFKDMTNDIFVCEKDTENVFELKFKMNIGKAGDTLALEPKVINYPDYVDCFGGYISLTDGKFFNIVSGSNASIGRLLQPFGFDSDVKVAMKADAETETAVCTDYSGCVMQDSMSREILDNYFSEDFDVNDDGVYEVVDTGYALKDPDSKNGVYSFERGKDGEITMYFWGRAAKYRIAAEINGEVTELFDGCKYADVEVTKGGQTTVTVKFNTTELPSMTSFRMFVTETETARPECYAYPDMYRATLYIK